VTVFQIDYISVIVLINIIVYIFSKV